MKLYDIFSDRADQNPLFAIVLGFFVYLLAGIFLVGLFGQTLASFLELDLATQKEILAGNLDASPHSKLFFFVYQGMHMVFSYGISSWLLMNLLGLSLQEKGFKSTSNVNAYLLAAMAMLGAIVWGQVLNFNPEQTYLPEIFSEWESSAQQVELRSRKLIMALLKVESPLGLIPIIFVMAVLPAVCEELFFRSFLQQQLVRLAGPAIGIAIGAFIFSFIHLQFHGFFGRLALGAMLGWMFWRSKSIYPSMIGHFVFNAVSLLGAYYSLKQNNWVLEKTESMNLPWYLTILAIAFSAASLYLFHLISTRTNTHEKEE
ncbi:MAG: CPBP family intramembrane metalloprotease [Bacteroidia bacterium]|nr:CPBP family intramembrane metalloprotease [Bacteroidia bacterium]